MNGVCVSSCLHVFGHTNICECACICMYMHMGPTRVDIRCFSCSQSTLFTETGSFAELHQLRLGQLPWVFPVSASKVLELQAATTPTWLFLQGFRESKPGSTHLYLIKHCVISPALDAHCSRLKSINLKNVNILTWKKTFPVYSPICCICVKITVFVLIGFRLVCSNQHKLVIKKSCFVLFFGDRLLLP